MDERSKVIVVPCSNYDSEKIYKSMKAGIDALGGMGAYVKPEEKVLVKPNFLTASAVEKAVTTHPSVILAMLRILQEAGCVDVAMGDSPGHGKSETVAKKIGLPESYETYGARPANMAEDVLVPFEEGIAAKEFHFTKEVATTDAIINLCKMKTHALERITGAVKNVYGFICGTQKAKGHVKYPNADRFARMLCDIHRAKPSRLHIMDGVIAMEGNGPGAGDSVSMGVLLFSTDPVALDTVFCRLVHLPPKAVPTCVHGDHMGIGTMDEKKIETEVVFPVIQKDEEGNAPACSDAPFIREPVSMEQLVKAFGNLAFNVNRRSDFKMRLWAGANAIMTGISRRPIIEKDKCIRCGICVDHCPVDGKAVDFKHGKDKPPVYDYRKCIRCYCCQEMCPQHAITVGALRNRQGEGSR